MCLCQLKLLRGRLTASVGRSEGARAPGRATSDLVQFAQESKGFGVTKRDVDHALVDPGGEGTQGSDFLTTADSAGAYKEAIVLAVQSSRHPELPETVDEGLPLCAVVAVAGGDAEEL